MKINLGKIPVMTKVTNFFNAIAPLTQFKFDLGEVLIIAFLEQKWKSNEEVSAHDLLRSVKFLSTASINRKLKQLKNKKILLLIPSAKDERFKIIKSGEKYNDYLGQIEIHLPNNHVKKLP